MIIIYIILFIWTKYHTKAAEPIFRLERWDHVIQQIQLIHSMHHQLEYSYIYKCKTKIKIRSDFELINC